MKCELCGTPVDSRDDCRIRLKPGDTTYCSEGEHFRSPDCAANALASISEVVD